MEYRKEQILIKQLPAAVSIKNFVEGNPIDCEEYLRDFINLSKLVEKEGNQPFVLRKHEEQSQGQPDIYNSSYELDFKILADEKYMEAKSMLSNSITELCPGLIAVGRARLPGESKRVFDVIKCLRYKTMKDLKDIENGIIRDSESKMIKQILSKISVDKNVLFFLPYDYFLKKIETDLNVVKFIISCIADDLKELLEYRKAKVKGDTFVAFISSKYFIITQERNNTLIFFDMIETSKNNLYSYLFNVGKL